MPMKNSTKLVKVLLTNVPIAISISLVASYLGLMSAGLPEGAFVPAFVSTAAINSLMAYAISFVIGWLIPSERWGFAFAGRCGLAPTDGVKFGLVLNVVVNTVYVTINAVILTYVNAIVMQGLPLAVFVPSLLGSYVPCWLVGYVVSLLWAVRAEAIARGLTNDPAPDMR